MEAVWRRVWCCLGKHQVKVEEDKDIQDEEGRSEGRVPDGWMRDRQPNCSREDFRVLEACRLPCKGGV